MQTHQDIWFSVGKEEEHVYFRTFDDNPELSPYLDFIPWPIKVSELRFSDGTSMDTAASGGSQTPWISDINADGFNLFGAGNISADNLDISTINGQPLSAFQTPWLQNVDAAGFYLLNALGVSTANIYPIDSSGIIVHSSLFVNNSLIVQNAMQVSPGGMTLYGNLALNNIVELAPPYNGITITSGSVIITANTIVMPGLPTSPSGLPSGSVWNNGGALNIV